MELNSKLSCVLVLKIKTPYAFILQNFRRQELLKILDLSGEDRKNNWTSTH